MEKRPQQLNKHTMTKSESYSSSSSDSSSSSSTPSPPPPPPPPPPSPAHVSGPMSFHQQSTHVPAPMSFNEHLLLHYGPHLTKVPNPNNPLGYDLYMNLKPEVANKYELYPHQAVLDFYKRLPRMVVEWEERLKREDMEKKKNLNKKTDSNVAGSSSSAEVSSVAADVPAAPDTTDEKP